MKVKLRLFASVREAVETAEEMLELPDHVLTLGDVRDYLCERGGVWAETFSPERPLRMAYGQKMCNEAKALTDGCEIAFFPPVTGG